METTKKKISGLCANIDDCFLHIETRKERAETMLSYVMPHFDVVNQNTLMGIQVEFDSIRILLETAIENLVEINKDIAIWEKQIEPELRALTIPKEGASNDC